MPNTENPLPDPQQELSRRNFLKIVGMAATGVVGRTPTPTLRILASFLFPPETSEASLDPEPSTLQESASKYLNSARKNIRNYPDGRRVIVPSEVYGDRVYMRDAFYALVGLNDPILSEHCFRFFEQSQIETGQIQSAVFFSPTETNEPRRDESNLIYLIWAGVLKRQGIAVDQNKIDKAFEYLKPHQEESLYISPTGNFHYWADTYTNPGADVITYNQGLYALSLRFLKEYRPNLISEETLAKAEHNYRSFFKPDLGFLPLSMHTTYQDASALLPEFLARYYFNKGMIPDNQIVSSVDHLLDTCSVYRGGDLQGIKVIAAADGSFLSPEVFNSPDPNLNGWGKYQNGGYWPMYTLASIALAYKITRDPKYKNFADRLTQKELGNDGKSKEFLYLSSDSIGEFNPERSDYSWNALLAAAFKWAGIT